MSLHQQRQIEHLKQHIMSLGGLVEEAVAHATRAVEQRDVSLAQTVIDGDEAIDQKEIEIEEECLHTLALYQPLAFDLRFVASVLKINNDLERIADLAVNIAEQACRLADLRPVDLSRFRLQELSRKARWMLKESLDSLVKIDADKADALRQVDDEVDEMHEQMYYLVEEALHEDPQQFRSLTSVLAVSRQMERIADHAVNIAEDVIYMARGDILRHEKAQRNKARHLEVDEHPGRNGDAPGSPESAARRRL